ncbi:MAG: LacI family transcriptional regulator [Boseongicola sp.]
MSAENKKLPTLKTIAEISGFAVPTVSRALKDAPDIGRSTKERVRQIAREIGYVPNRAGVRLKTGRTNVISLVLSTDHDMMNHTARLISAIAGALRETPYHMIVTPYFPEEDPMTPVRYIVETGSADAVILNQTEPRDERVAYLMERDFPFATHGRTDWCNEHPYFDFDNASFARGAVRQFITRGRRNLLIVAPPLTQSYAQHMVFAAQEEVAEAAVSIKVIPDVTSDSGSKSIKHAVANYLGAHPETDAILCASPTAAMAAVSALENCGRHLGEDIDVLAKEAVPFLRLFRPALMAVSEDVSRAGEFLANAAIQAISQPASPPLQGLDVPTDFT